MSVKNKYQTIDSIHKNIIQKINYLEQLNSLVKKYCNNTPNVNDRLYHLQFKTDPHINYTNNSGNTNNLDLKQLEISQIDHLQILNEINIFDNENDIDNLINSLIDLYHSSTSSILSKYYENTNIDGNILSIDYNKIISNEKIINKLNEIFDIINYEFKINDILIEQSNRTYEINKIINEFKKINLTIQISLNDYRLCSDCNKTMIICAEKSSIYCENCGVTKFLTGVVFEDNQIYHQEGKRAKHGDYDPNGHCQRWLEKIQAKPNKRVTENHIESVKQKMLRDYGTSNIDNIKIKQIKCSKIREWLKELKITSLNHFAPYIRKELTGITPPELSFEEKTQIKMIFQEVTLIQKKYSYHPYIIYKIIDIILPDDDRKNRILECIHMQDQKTVQKNDISWKDICAQIEIKRQKNKAKFAKIPPLSYRPTVTTRITCY